jgi:phosphoenolpyruvate carboxylase
MGYHLRPIEKGVFGEPSKIREELDELEEALEQNNNIMAMVELSDMYGAMKAFALHYFDLDMEDLRIMSEATERAFKDGSRQ